MPDSTAQSIDEEHLPPRDRILERVTEGIVALDPDFRYTCVNEQAERILDKRREQLLGERVWDVFPETKGTVTQEKIEAAMATQEKRSFERYNSDRDQWFEVRVYPDESGLSIYLTEITERKQPALEQNQKRLQALLDKLPDAVAIHDVDGNVLMVNDQIVDDLGYLREELLSMNVTNFEVGIDQEELQDLWTTMEVGDQRKVSGRNRRKDGSTFPVRVWVDKVEIGGEKRFMALGRDVTDRVQREEELRRQNERLDEFAGVVAHDLRNPLNIAQGRTTLADEELEREDHESLHLQKAQEALGRMEDIIMDMLVLARQGGEVEAPEPVAVADLVEQSWDMVDTAEASLVVDDECTITGDPDRLRHVCENLFRNAIEHGGDNVTVRVGQAGDSTLYVEDDGPGIPPERREAIFTPRETSQEDGTGFGLAIVKRIAEAHGWEVTLTDAGSGGARFAFSGVDFRS